MLTPVRFWTKYQANVLLVIFPVVVRGSSSKPYIGFVAKEKTSAVLSDDIALGNRYRLRQPQQDSLRV